jgi:hypothetical protein
LIRRSTVHATRRCAQLALTGSGAQPPLVFCHGYPGCSPLGWLIGAHAAPSVPKEKMKIRLFGALLCGGLLVLVASTTSFAQSGKNNTVHGNFIGTSRGAHQSPADFNQDGRRKSKATHTDIGSVENARRFRLLDNQSPRPQDRKANRKKSSDPAIFDRWGRTQGGDPSTYFVGTANGGVWRR